MHLAIRMGSLCSRSGGRCSSEPHVTGASGTAAALVLVAFWTTPRGAARASPLPALPNSGLWVTHSFFESEKDAWRQFRLVVLLLLRLFCFKRKTSFASAFFNGVLNRGYKVWPSFTRRTRGCPVSGRWRCAGGHGRGSLRAPDAVGFLMAEGLRSFSS